MDTPYLQLVQDWLASNPHLAGMAVFLIACSESLAVVGLVMPGAVLLFLAGAAIGTGSLPFASTMAWAVAGAIVGDGLSYGLGRHYGERLRGLWPFRRYPALTERGVEFFQRHGGKSVALGRFVGPLRPIVPAVAGMLGMPAHRFFAVNLTSAFFWAPAYLLPGMAFGASLAVASEVAGRLTVFLVALLAVLWLVAWGLRRAWRFLAPRAGSLLYRALYWSRRHPVLGEVPAGLLDPQHPELRSLAALALTLMAGAGVFVWLSEAVGAGALLAGVDRWVHFGLQDLRTPWGDRVMAAATGFGDYAVAGMVVLAVAAWLGLRRDWLALAHWLGATLVPYAMTHLLKLAGGVARPLLVEGMAEGYAFPSGHAAHSAAIYGFLAVLLAQGLRLPWPALVYTTAGLLVAVVGLSRLYLGVHWLSDVLGGLALGVAWVALMGIAFRRHCPPLPRAALAGAAAAGLLAAMAMNALVRFPANVRAYEAPLASVQVGAGQWWQSAWADLPARREDLRRRPGQALRVQWAGEPAAIRQTLIGQGWHSPPEGALDLLQWLRPAPDPDLIPVLPQVHAGRHEVLRLTRAGDSGAPMIILRLWPTGLRLAPADTPVWVGALGYLRPATAFGVTTLRPDPGAEAPLTALTAALAGGQWELRAVERSGEPALLLRPAASGAVR